MINEDVISRLLDAARRVRRNAYAPYSGFTVGAAVLSAEGAIYTGANCENASFGLSICAERVALTAAMAASAKTVVALAVVADRPAPPCGACRQVLLELAPQAVVIWEDGAGGYILRPVKELLPMPFCPSKLKP